MLWEEQTLLAFSLVTPIEVVHEKNENNLYNTQDMKCKMCKVLMRAV